MTVILVIICFSMVITLIPGLMNTAATSSPDAVAKVGNVDISAADVQRELNQVTRGQNIPPMLKGMYTKQVLDQVIFQQYVPCNLRPCASHSTKPEYMVRKIRK